MITLEIAAPEFVRRFQSGEIPDSAHVVVTYEPAQPADVAASNDAWDDADALSGAELEAERELYQQFERGINQSREAAQTRIL